MRRHNAENEVAKRDYLAWMKNAKGRQDATLDQIAASIHQYEAHTRYAPFKLFRREKAIAFKEHLSEQTNAKTGKPLSHATQHAILSAVRAFFEWLSREPGYKRKLVFSDAAYFSMTANDARVATARRDRDHPSLAQVQKVIQSMPTDSATRRRDRAVVAFILLTGARDAAVASMRLKHVDLMNNRVIQDPREVRTKRAKTFTSFFYPVGDLALQVVTDWMAELRDDHQFGGDDPLFPASRAPLNADGLFEAGEMTRRPWTSAQPIRDIFKRAFPGAGVSYFPPHTIRHTLVDLGYELDLSVKEFKAWSQNLGHESAQTTLTSYGTIPVEEQGRLMASLGRRKGPPRADLSDLLFQAAAELAALKG